MPPSSQTLRSAFQSAAHQWPKDALRPSLQFSQSILKASDKIFLPTNATSKDNTGPLNELSKVQTIKAEEAIKSLHRLIENRALKAVSSPFSLLSLAFEGSILMCSYNVEPNDGENDETRKFLETLREDSGRHRSNRERRSVQEEVVP